MKINWKVRLLSVKFWLALVPAILLLAQAVAAPFGYKWDFANLGTVNFGSGPNGLKTLIFR